MTIHIGVLPLDILHTLSTALNTQTGQGAGTTDIPLLRLPHPRTGLASLFLPYESKSASSKASIKIAEVQAVSTPDPRSWFIGETVSADGKLLVMTPLDPTFLLIPILQAAYPNDHTSGNFRPADDIFEEASLKLQSLSPQIHPDSSFTISAKDIISFTSLVSVRNALVHVCDMKVITSDIVVYRPSLEKSVEYLRTKVARLATPEIFEVSRTLIRDLARDGLMEDGKEKLLEAGRIRAACDLLAQYLPPNVKAAMIKSYDFTELDGYLRSIQDEAVASTNTNTATTAKPKATEALEERKRKNAKGSYGVEKLKKVNVNGMAKLSSFFKKS